VNLVLAFPIHKPPPPPTFFPIRTLAQVNSGGVVSGGVVLGFGEIASYAALDSVPWATSERSLLLR